MSQNTSHAVMSQRVEPKDSLDYFPTPPWATRALCEWIAGRIGREHMRRNLVAWDPACGEGHMVRPLREYFADVLATDVRDYGFPGQEVDDFLFCGPQTADWIVTNPPFRLAKEFALEGFRRAPNALRCWFAPRFWKAETDSGHYSIHILLLRSCNFLSASRCTRGGLSRTGPQPRPIVGSFGAGLRRSDARSNGYRRLAVRLSAPATI